MRGNKAYDTEGKPRYLRVYDNGGTTFDRYTVVFTRQRDGICRYLGMSIHPFHPQGFGQHGEDRKLIDYPAYSHLGKKITFDDLPPDCKRCTLATYNEMWGEKERKEREKHLAALRKSKRLHPDELKFLMQHGAEGKTS